MSAAEREARGSPLRAVDRALSILATFQDGQARQTLSEISRHAELPVSTTFRIVERLREWGALERDENQRYHIGLRLWEVSTLAPRSMTLQRIAQPVMHDLYEITSCSIHLAIREGHESVFVVRIENPRHVIEGPRVGFRHSMHATAVGRVLLAHAEAAVRDEILAELPSAGAGRVDLPALRRDLADVRARGYAVSGPDLSAEYIAVAAPVTTAGQEIAALSIVVPLASADVRRTAHLVRAAAGSISRVVRQQVGQ